MRPGELEPEEMQAVSLIDRGDVAAGLALSRLLLPRADVAPETANRHLILSHYDPAEDNESLFRIHADWVRRYIHPFRMPFTERNALDPDRPLRVAWISPRFCIGPVASFFRDVLTALDRQQFRHTLVSLGAIEDTATINFRKHADEWLALSKLNDEMLLERLRAENFDIAIDLAGHSFGNRLGVLAQRIAPIQLCWLDYFNTTGVPTIDGWISDDRLTPDDSPQRYVEKLLRLSSGRLSYSPPDEAPETEHVGGTAPVFVSFNRLSKLNDNVVDAWAKILRAVPEAFVELGAGLLGDAVARERTIERFADRDIGGERLRLHAKRSYIELLAAYRGADIALDPFPFSGCTTTCDALWMGVPVLTLPGTTFVSRQSASMLWQMGCDEWVAQTVENYIERAIIMARHVDELRARRGHLRELTRKTLCDSVTQANEFAVMLRKLWRNHCSTEQQASR